MPASLAALVHDRRWTRSLVGEAGAAVYRLARRRRRGARRRPDDETDAGDLYLKHGQGGIAADVLDEAVRLRWLAAYLPVPRLRHLEVGAGDAWLLTDALPGRTAYQLLEAHAGEPAVEEAVVDALADFLRRLHAIPVAHCPFASDHPRRLAQARARLEAGAVDEDDFGALHAGSSAEDVWAAMTALLPFDADPVVTHGDYSLDNVLCTEADAPGGVAVVGCLDLGRVGVADRYQDLAILWDDLGEFDAALRARLVARYGLDTLDERRLRFHLALDEFF